MQHLNQSPTCPEFVQDPYPFYDRARSTGPLFFWTEYNMVCANAHSSVGQLLKHPKMGREVPDELAPAVPAHLKPFYDIEAHSMLELEGPRHKRLRGLVLRAFTSRRIAGLEPEIEALCHDLIDQFPQGSFDLIHHFARLVPIIIICRLLGVPEKDAERLLSWSNAMVAMYQASRTTQTEYDAAKASTEFSHYVADYIEYKRRNPADDLLTELIAAEENGQKLSQPEMITTCILLLNAGHEATVHTLGNGVATLLQHAVRHITPQAVEEVIRYDPPLHMFTRWVYEDVEVAGHLFRRGDQVACLLAAANRDPLAYPEPNTFDPERRGPVNTSFGGGIHFCVGAPLARLELVVALRVLFQRCPDLHLTEAPVYANLYHFHGLHRLMVAS